MDDGHTMQRLLLNIRVVNEHNSTPLSDRSFRIGLLLMLLSQ